MISFSPWQHLRRAIVHRFSHILTKELQNYAFRFPNDLAALKRHIQKGDIILVEGSQRVSEVIKYLTQSSWSHAALYIGDELIRRSHPLAGQYRAAFGEEAEFLLIEALVEEGVVASPVSKYLANNIRVCRPHGLRRDDLQVLLDDVVSQLSYTYDLQNIFDLARYFLPVSLIPRRFRRKALYFGSREPTEVICSSIIASAFDRIGFPIIPQVASQGQPPQKPQLPLWRRLVRTSDGDLPPLVFRRQHPTLVTPRDFDLSPYFEVIKFNVIESRRFDYHQIIWAEEEAADKGQLEDAEQQRPIEVGEASDQERG